MPAIVGRNFRSVVRPSVRLVGYLAPSSYKIKLEPNILYRSYFRRQHIRDSSSEG